MRDPLAAADGTVTESPSASLQPIGPEQESRPKPLCDWERFKCEVCQGFVYRDECMLSSIFLLISLLSVGFALLDTSRYEDYRWGFTIQNNAEAQYDWLDGHGQKLLDLTVRSGLGQAPTVVLNSWSNTTGWGTEVVGPLPQEGETEVTIIASDSGWRVGYDNTTLHMSNRLPWTSFASLAYNTTTSPPLYGPTSYFGQANWDFVLHRLNRVLNPKKGTSISGQDKVFVFVLLFGSMSILVGVGFFLFVLGSVPRMFCCPARVCSACEREVERKRAACEEKAERKRAADAAELLEQARVKAHCSGVTVQQIWRLWEQIQDDMLEYSSCHYLDAKHKHVCREKHCRFGDHRGVEFTSEGEGMFQAPLKPMEPNMHLVVSRYVKHFTAGQGQEGAGCSYATFLNRGCPLRATHFVSHCWDHNFESFATALLAWEETTVWVCSFALNQHGNIQEMLGDDVTQSPFALALQKATEVLLVIDEKALPLTRSWCVYEIWLARKEGKQPMIVLDWKLDKDTLSLLEHNVKQLDLRNCTASNQEDHDRIMKAIKDVSNVEALNSMVRGSIEWSTRQARHMMNFAQSPTRAGTAGRSTMAPFDGISDHEPRNTSK